MNGVLSLPQGMVPITIAELRTFVGLPAKKKSARLSASTDELVSNIAGIVNELLLSAIEKRTGAEFASIRDEVFPQYVMALRALSDLLRIVVPDRSVLERLVRESFSELEADFREHGLPKFGADVRDQALFTVWTLRKTSDTIWKIADSVPIAEDLREADLRLAKEFGFNAIWTQFHLGCLILAIRRDKPVYPDVLPQISEGLRAAVNAYAWIKQVARLRIPPTDPVLTPVEWDEEDEKLLASSMREIESEAS